MTGGRGLPYRYRNTDLYPQRTRHLMFTTEYSLSLRGEILYVGRHSGMQCSLLWLYSKQTWIRARDRFLFNQLYWDII